MFELIPASYLEIHTLKSHAASNLNRDQNNRPKTAITGGCQRLRVSPQAEIHSIKNSYPFQLYLEAAQKQFGTVEAISTRFARNKIKEMILEKWKNHKSFNASVNQKIDHSLESYPAIFGGKKSDNGKTPQNIPYTKEELEFFADLIVDTDNKGKIQIKDLSDELKKIKNISYGSLNPMLPLFGRFTATTLSYLGHIDSPLHLAHAETVHEAAIQRDYFTAIDDLNEEQNVQGFAHGNTKFFGSGVYYNYYTLDIRLLAKNMTKALPSFSRDQLLTLTNGLIKAFVYGVLIRNPVSMITRHAHYNLPSLVYLTYGSCFPYSASSAFEKPVQRSRDGGYLDNAVNKFIDWRNQREKRFKNFIGDDIYWGLNDDRDKDLGSFVSWVFEHTQTCLNEVFDES